MRTPTLTFRNKCEPPSTDFPTLHPTPGSNNTALKQVGTGLEQLWNRLGTGLEQAWNMLGTGLEQAWNTRKRLVTALERVGSIRKPVFQDCSSPAW
jgi:hypothetical protein